MADPQALHAELLLKIEAERVEAYSLDEVANASADTLADALVAALALHEPEQHYSIGQDNRLTPSYQMCSACHCMANKCQTVKVISAALGVTTDG